MRLRQARLHGVIRRAETHVDDAGAQIDRNLHTRIDIGDSAEAHRLVFTRKTSRAENTDGQ